MPKPLVFFPSERTAPDDVIRHLREIDPTFELVWVVDRWLLGRVRWTRLRYEQAGRIREAALVKAVPDPALLIWTRLALQGFASTATYEHEADGRIVEDARIRIYNLQNRAEEAFAERLDESEGGPRLRSNLARVRDGAQAVAPDAWRRAFKRPVYGRPFSRSVHA